MIAYNPKEWFTFIFKFHKAETFQKLMPMMLAMAAYTALICFIEIKLLKIASESHLSKIAVMHSLLGFVISMLLVFRTNTAYDRWWEGRKFWGQLVNCSRNLSLKIQSNHRISIDEKQVAKSLLISFPFALKNHLRGMNSMEDAELEAIYHIEELKTAKHLPLQIANRFFLLLNSWSEKKQLETEQYLSINQDLQQWMEICGACERIKNTPIPFSYSVFIKKFIFFYVMTLPLAYAGMMGFVAIPMVVFVFYVLASLELIAEEIESPFGSDANDLPLDEICKNIRRSVDMIMEK